MHQKLDCVLLTSAFKTQPLIQVERDVQVDKALEKDKLAQVVQAQEELTVA